MPNLIGSGMIELGRGFVGSELAESLSWPVDGSEIRFGITGSSPSNWDVSIRPYFEVTDQATHTAPEWLEQARRYLSLELFLLQEPTDMVFTTLVGSSGVEFSLIHDGVGGVDTVPSSRSALVPIEYFPAAWNAWPDVVEKYKVPVDLLGEVRYRGFDLAPTHRFLNLIQACEALGRISTDEAVLASRVRALWDETSFEEPDLARPEFLGANKPGSDWTVWIAAARHQLSHGDAPRPDEFWLRLCNTELLKVLKYHLLCHLEVPKSVAATAAAAHGFLIE